MRAAVDSALASGPGFLRGEIDADTMATTMVRAAQGYAAREQTAGAAAADPRAAQWREALAELMTCGSGYLAGRCDADCVARTVAYLLGEHAAG